MSKYKRYAYEDLDSEAFDDNRELHDELVTYGDMLHDIETEEADGYRRIRVFEYNDDKFLHHMFNGKVIEIVKL